MTIHTRMTTDREVENNLLTDGERAELEQAVGEAREEARRTLIPFLSGLLERMEQPRLRAELNITIDVHIELPELDEGDLV